MKSIDIVLKIVIPKILLTPIFSLQKMSDNVFNLSAQDLLSKSHEELVLLLIHLRRQMATLSEAIDGSRSELENITNTIVTSSDDKDSLGEF